MPEALKRDANVNYYEGWFFVTLNTRNGAPLLSYCVGNVRVANGEPNAPHCQYTQLGQGVIDAWHEMSNIHPFVETDLCEAMPEHFHGLVHLLPGNKRHLGHLIGGFMGGCSHAYWDTLGIDWHKDRYDTGTNALKIDRDRDHTRSYRGPALFVRGYNDVEALTPEEVEIKRRYILDNPRKRLIQGDRHQCFRKYRHVHTPSWTIERVMSAIALDKTFCHDAQRCEQAIANVKERLNADLEAPGIGLDYIGCRTLLFAPKKLPLICHRTDAPLFDQQKEAVMHAAREGTVIVSAFISPKERDIGQQLMKEQLPFIEVIDNGLSDKYKGVGKAFYALAEERLCQITPWRYQYQKEMKVSREMCLVMNELTRILCGVNDDWWKSTCCSLP